MKKLLIVIPYKKFYTFLIIALVLSVVFTIAVIAYPGSVPAYDRTEEDEMAGLEKENARLYQILKSIAPPGNQFIYEDQYRNHFLNVQGHTPPSFKTFSSQEVLDKGRNIKFNILSERPYYLRPLYDPSWKGAYFRGWLNLSDKNIEARHRLFIFPFGGSSNFDFTGSLGVDAGVSVNYHKNTNFLIYGFSVKSVKCYENQVVLLGEPLRAGLQIVSVVQDDLLSDGINTKDILFQLCTPQGYEIDFIYGNVIRYEYLKKQIEENSVKPVSSGIDGYTAFERLLNENLSLKKELSYFIPLEDKVITQEKCRPIPPNFPLEAPDIQTVKAKSKDTAFQLNYRNSVYKRPVYDPQWLKSYRRRWCFIPGQVCRSQHKLFLVPVDPGEQSDFFGILSFHESFKPIRTNEYGFLVYNFHVSTAAVYNNQLLLTGIPSRTGAEIIAISRSLLQAQTYLVRLVTPDNQEVDYVLIQ